MDVRRVNDDFFVAGQVSPADMTALKADGFTTLINNRPDGEAADQPSGPEIEQAAVAAGLTYVAVPIASVPPGSREARDTVEGAGGKTLAFCRSGTRSVMAWAMGRVAAGELSGEEAVKAAAGAGYDLRPIKPLLSRAAPVG